MEVRKANGEPYTPRTILQILAGLLRYMREQKKHVFNLMDSKAFPELHRLLDSLFRNLHAHVGTDRRQAKVIGFDEERQLWASGALSTDTPQELLNAVFYYNGVILALRGGDEHNVLKLSQMVIKAVQDPDDPSKEIDCLVYMEHGSKNRLGNSKQVNLENKVVTQFSKLKLGDKCHVQLVKKYISKLPPIAFQKDVFYWRPKRRAIASLPDHVWYDSVPIGYNTLKTKMKVVFEFGWSQK